MVENNVPYQLIFSETGLNRLAVVDHLPFAQCAGFAGSAFNEMQTIWHDTHNQWATVFSEALREVIDRVTSPNLHTEQEAVLIWSEPSSGSFSSQYCSYGNLHQLMA